MEALMHHFLAKISLKPTPAQQSIDRSWGAQHSPPHGTLLPRAESALGGGHEF